MGTRGHTGNLNIDYEAKTLDFDVTVKGSLEGVDTNTKHEAEPAKKKQKKTTDTKTLSGGERAFTTIAFLMALGEARDNPVGII